MTEKDINTGASQNRNKFIADQIAELVARRKELGLTQDDVNHKIGVADRLLSKWECGARTPNLFNLFCWAKALGLNLNFVPDLAANDNFKPPDKK